VAWRELQAGVYECRRGTDAIRVVVLGQLLEAEQNAALHLFSAAPRLVEYGRIHYRQRSPDTSTLLYQLFEGYRREGLDMPYTMEDFRRDFTKEFLTKLTPEERLEGLSPEEVLKALSPEEVLKALPRQAIEDYLKRQPNGSSSAPQQEGGQPG
jgi:hypothetical protein